MKSIRWRCRVSSERLCARYLGHQMASGAMMPGLVGYQRGFLLMAKLLRHWASIGEAATFGQVHRVRRVAGD